MPQREELHRLSMCLQALQDTVRNMGMDWQVRPFGSIANGFGTAGSDLDVTCYREGIDAQNSALAVQELKQRLLPVLLHHLEF